MSKIKKTWVEKRDCDKEPLVKINPKSWSDMPKGIKMFIPTPKIVNQFVCNIPKGNFKNMKSLRRDMAVDFDAQMSCPMVTGISLRIISEASYEKHMLGIKKNNAVLESCRTIFKIGYETGMWNRLYHSTSRK